MTEPDDDRRPGRGFVLTYTEALWWPAQRNLYRKSTADNLYYVNSITKGVVLQHYACWRELRKQDRFLQWRPG